MPMRRQRLSAKIRSMSQQVAAQPPSQDDLERYLGTAWATARLLGATFAPACWQNLRASILASVTNPPPIGDAVAVAATASERNALGHARVMRLVALMYESAIAGASSGSVLAPAGEEVVVLHEWTLAKALQFKLCLWPFWVSGC